MPETTVYLNLCNRKLHIVRLCTTLTSMNHTTHALRSKPTSHRPSCLPTPYLACEDGTHYYLRCTNAYELVSWEVRVWPSQLNYVYVFSSYTRVYSLVYTTPLRIQVAMFSKSCYKFYSVCFTHCSCGRTTRLLFVVIISSRPNKLWMISIFQ